MQPFVKRFILAELERLFLSITFAMASILLISGIVGYRYFREILEDRVLTDQQQILAACTEDLSGMINEIDRLSYYLASNRAFSDILNRNSRGEISNAYANQLLSELFFRYINVPYSASPVNFHIILYLSEKIPLSSSFSNFSLERISSRKSYSTTFQNEKNILSAPWFQQANLLSGSLYPFTLPEQPDTIYFARTIQHIYLTDSAPDYHLGTLVFTISRKDLQAILNRYSVFKGTQEYFSYKNHILCSNEGAPVLQYLTDCTKFSSISDQSGFQPVTVNNSAYYANRQNLSGGLSLLFLLPVEEIFRSLNDMAILIAIELFAAILAGLAISAFLAFHFTKPLLRLSTAIQKVENPQRPALVPEEKHRTDEIGLLFRRYNDMLRRISALTTDLQVSIEARKTAEIHALQAQINPHFVFNTLDSINWIALCENQQEISLMVTSLARMLRYSIRTEEDGATLQEELNYLEEYCKIQKLRYPDSFDLTTQIPEPLLSYMVPRILLQPLVENAILHSQLDQQKPSSVLNILIGCELRSDALILRVCDSGPGDPEQINGYLRGENTLIPKGGGFGIRNVDRRLKLWYGPEYGLSYSYWQEGNRIRGITAELLLPLPKEK